MSVREIFRHLIAVFRVKITERVTDLQIFYRPVHLIFLLPVDELIGALTRDSHDVALIFIYKKEGAVRHSFFEHLNLCDFLHAAVQRCGNPFENIGLQVFGISVHLAKLLIRVDFTDLSRRADPCPDFHLSALHQRIFPEGSRTGSFFVHLQQPCFQPSGIFF